MHTEKRINRQTDGQTGRHTRQDRDGPKGKTSDKPTSRHAVKNDVRLQSHVKDNPFLVYEHNTQRSVSQL